MTVVELENVTKTYGTVKALDGVSLAIPEGQTVALLGPNGAGKTTAISLMLGLRRPTAGRVRLFDARPEALAVRSRVGVMLQSSGIAEHLRVGEAIELFRTYYPRPLDFERIVDAAGLDHLLRAKIATLSGGELQRLYFAVAICGDPRAVFLDEPTVGLDVHARRALLETIRVIAAEGRSIVLTTHYLEEADALADRIVVVDRGRVVADDAPSAIKAGAGVKRVSFACDPEREPTLPAELVTDVRRAGARIDFLSAEPEMVLRELFARGFVPRDLLVTGATLEEAFVAMTGQERQYA